MMKYLVDKGANNFAEALLKAVMRQKVEIVKYLVETMLERNIPLNLFAVVRYDISMNPDENFQVIKYFIDTFLERLNLQFLANIAEAKGKNKIYNYLISKI